jgi:hypothetical protein
MQPSFQSLMNSGINMTRFRAWMDPTHMVRKLVLIEVGNNTQITITLTITSINQPMNITMPSTTLIFVLPGTTGTVTPTPSMTATPTVHPTVTTTPVMGATPTPMATNTAGAPGTPAPVPTGTGPTHW